MIIFVQAKKMKKLIIISSILSAIGVIMGAFGAHALKDMLTEIQLKSYETGVKYHLIHSVSMLVLAILYHQTKTKLFYTAGMLMFTGILLFSFSIYLLSCKELLGIENWTFLGPITPIGGSFIIISWGLVCLAGLKLKND